MSASVPVAAWVRIFLFISPYGTSSASTLMFGFLVLNSSTNLTSCSQPTPAKRASLTVAAVPPVAGWAAAGALAGLVAATAAGAGLPGALAPGTVVAAGAAAP